ncbi:MAG: hypothetical protein ACO1HP_11280 [Bacteroidota bacterium]|jgi:hypothetical protein
MLKKALNTFLVLLSTVRMGYSQHVDTALVLKHLKLRLLIELPLGLLSESALNDYYKRELQATVLKSKGFENLIFFKISEQILAVDTIKGSRKIAIYRTPTCLKNGEDCYFVYAYDKENKGFYKLKSTHTNDFVYVYNDLQDKWMWWKPIKKINESIIDQFTKDYWIDDVDLACLLRSLTGKRGNCLDYFSPELEVH